MENTLHANIREKVSKGENHRLRNSGRIPGVIYGLNNANFSVEFAQEEIFNVLNKSGGTAIVDVSVNGSSEKAMLKEVQRDPLTRKVTHVDLQRVDNIHKVHAKVPVVVRGEDRLKGMGAMAQIQVDHVEVECTPDKLPRQIIADISRLDVGQKLTVAQLEIAEEIAVLNDPNTIIAAISYIKSNTDENILPNAAGSMHADDAKK
jgi:large subunit ribosomal protein L25